MKKGGVINAELGACLARLRHTDTFCVADSGLPVPPNVPCIDLALAYGIPRFEEVLRVVLAEVVVEHGWIASEIASANADCEHLIDGLLPRLTRISHEELKQIVGKTAFVVRTGEAKPYANVVLRAGVAFA